MNNQNAVKLAQKKQSKHSYGSEAGELNIHSYSHGSGDLTASSVVSTVLEVLIKQMTRQMVNRRLNQCNTSS